MATSPKPLASNNLKVDVYHFVPSRFDDLAILARDLASSIFMPTIPLTRSKHLLPFASFMGKAGEPVGQLLQKAKLPSHCLDDPETLIPSDAAFHFRQLAAQTAGLPNIAIDATQSLEISDLGDFGRVLLRAPTLYKLLTKFRRLTSTQTTMAVIELHQHGTGNVSLCHHFEYASEFELWHNDLYILQWTIKLVRLVVPDWSPSVLWVGSSYTDERETAVEAMGIPQARFGHNCTGFAVPSSMLALPLYKTSTNPRDQSISDEVLRSTSPEQTYSGALRQVIGSYAGDRWLGIEQAAEVVGTSVRTMQRRLSAEDTSYSNVLEGTRSEAAANLLENTDATLAEIALQLGYKRQGNFTRAFRRWAGVSPNAFRQQRRAR
jgi:AraC-like DNA-binding protein